MSEVSVKCEVTEYASMPPKEHNEVVFSINEKSLVISFCDINDVVLTQSEIDRKDAIELAKLILIKYR